MKLALLVLALATTALAQDKPRGPARVSGGVMQGLLVSKAPVVYPAEAKRNQISGSVVLHAIIGKNGHIANLTVVSGPDVLAEAAIASVSQWVYRPYLLNGEPTEIDTTITVNFTFGSGPAPANEPPPAPGDDRRVHLTTVQLKSFVLHKVPPVYPLVAKQARISGAVIVHAIIATDGHVASVDSVAGPLELQQSALEAVSQWTYKPYVVDGIAREVDTEVTINFAFGN